MTATGPANSLRWIACFALAASFATGTPAEAREPLRDIVTPQVATSPSRSDLQRLFEQGNQLFRSGLEQAKTDKSASATDFRDAAAAWRTVAETGGIHNARLETNIANASLLAGDVPRAIAAFRRAQAIDPLDTTIRNGLAAARRAAGTETLAPGANALRTDAAIETGFRGTLRRISDAATDTGRSALVYLPERALFWTATLSYLAAFTLAGARLLHRRRIPAWAPAGVLTIAILCAAPLIARDLSAEPEGVVIAPGQFARNGPADLYEPAFKEPLAPGLEVRIEERRQGWARIRLHDGRAAWIEERALEPL